MNSEINRRWEKVLTILLQDVHIQQQDRAEAFVSASLILESLLLGDLGAELNFLDEVSFRFLSRLSAAYYEKLLPRTHLREPARREFVEHSGISLEMTRVFPKFIVSIELGLRGDRVIEPWPVTSGEVRMKSIYEFVVLMHLDMIESLAMKRYLKAFRYATTMQWRSLMQSEPSSLDIFMSANVDSPELGAVVCYGFLRQWGFWADLNKCFNELEAAVDFIDFVRFTERVRSIFNWRIDPSSTELFSRFEGLKSLLEQRAVAELPQSERYAFRKLFNELFDGVFGFETA